MIETTALIKLIGLIILLICALINAAAFITHLRMIKRIRDAKKNLDQLPEFNPPFHPMCRCSHEPTNEITWDPESGTIVSPEAEPILQVGKERLCLDDGVLKSIPVDDLLKDMTDSELIDIATFIRKNKHEKHTRG